MEEIKEKIDTVKEDSNTNKDDQTPLSPEAKYIFNIFRKEKIDEFLDSLNDEQKKFVYIFVSGFQTALNKNIVGIYSKDYIVSRELTEDLLKSYSIKVKEISVNDIDLNFMIIWQ